MLKKSLILFSVLFIAQAVYASDTQYEAKNKANVLKFYNFALNDKNFDAAKPFLGNTYTQHNPTAKDGINGFRDFISFLKKTYPNSHSEIKRVLADGDYVILHVSVTGREPGLTRAIVDIFRLDTQNKIVEHWDVIQKVPQESANDNGMF